MYFGRKKPRKIADVLQKEFIRDMGPGLKQGMVLKVYKAKIKEATRREGFSSHIKSARLVPGDRDAAGFDNPTLVVRMKPGSHWRQELHMQRVQIKELINERLGDEFLKEVRFR